MLGLVALILYPLGMLWEGYVLTLLWKWHVVGTFGLPPLMLANAIGLSVLVSLVTNQRPRGDGGEDSEERLTASLAWTFALPLVCLCIGWLAK